MNFGVRLFRLCKRKEVLIRSEDIMSVGHFRVRGYGLWMSSRFVSSRLHLPSLFVNREGHSVRQIILSHVYFLIFLLIGSVMSGGVSGEDIWVGLCSLFRNIGPHWLGILSSCASVLVGFILVGRGMVLMRLVNERVVLLLNGSGFCGERSGLYSGNLIKESLTVGCVWMGFRLHQIVASGDFVSSLSVELVFEQ